MSIARALTLLAAATSLVAGCGAPAGEPFVEEVVEVSLGHNAGFGEEADVLGPPEGSGELAGSLNALSLGQGGVITVRLGTPAVDGEGPDLIVFENAFRFSGGIFKEPGQVSVSADGESWVSFSCADDDEELTGCAGLEPVFAHPDNDLDPRDPEEAGGDAFDLADVGVSDALFIRIEDVSIRPASELNNAGFDLDAVAAVHTYFD